MVSSENETGNDGRKRDSRRNSRSHDNSASLYTFNKCFNYAGFARHSQGGSVRSHKIHVSLFELLSIDQHLC